MLTESWQRRGWYRDREGLAANGRQFHGRHQQTIGPSRAEGTSIRQIGDTNQLTQVWRRSSMSGPCTWARPSWTVLSPEPRANRGWRARWRCGLSDAGRRWAVLPRSSLTEDAGTGRQEDQPDGISVVQPRQYQQDNKSLECSRWHSMFKITQKTKKTCGRLSWLMSAFERTLK